MFDNQMPNVSGNTGGTWGNDYSGRLNDMLAPYQQMMGRVNSPYATMGANGWLQQNHPQVAGVLDNAFLNIGMTPQATGPEGFGGGLTRAMQGMIGGQQYNRQRMIQGAMLPYQMVQQQLGAMDTMSQINERNVMVPFRQAQERYMNSRDENYQSMIAARDKAKSFGRPLTDDKGNNWQEVIDPSGKLSYVDPNTGKSSQELGVTPSFNNEQRNQRMSQPGGLLGETYNMMNSPDVATRLKGQALHAQYLQDQSLIAGGRASAVQNATQPVKDIETMVKNERAATLAGLPKIQGANEWQMANMTNPDTYKPGAYDKYVKQQTGQRQQTMVDLDKYEKSSAPKQGVNFQQYMQQRDQYDGSAPSPAPSTVPNSDSGSKWTPK